MIGADPQPPKLVGLWATGGWKKGKFHLIILKIGDMVVRLQTLSPPLYPGLSQDNLNKKGERGGSVVECRTPEREVRGSRPTAAVLCP